MIPLLHKVLFDKHQVHLHLHPLLENGPAKIKSIGIVRLHKRPFRLLGCGFVQSFV